MAPTAAEVLLALATAAGAAAGFAASQIASIQRGQTAAFAGIKNQQNQDQNVANLLSQAVSAAKQASGSAASAPQAQSAPSLDSASTPLVTLAQELVSTRAYLEIERVRFGDRLRYTIENVDSLTRVRVPRFSLQTLVENSVKYAISQRRDGGTVRVFAEDAGTTVRLVVEDDGPGFEPGNAPSHHGLALLKERLALSFGGRAALHVTSRPGQTRVIVEVPT